MQDAIPVESVLKGNFLLLKGSFFVKEKTDLSPGRFRYWLHSNLTQIFVALPFLVENDQDLFAVSDQFRLLFLGGFWVGDFEWLSFD